MTASARKERRTSGLRRLGSVGNARARIGAGPRNATPSRGPGRSSCVGGEMS